MECSADGSILTGYICTGYICIVTIYLPPSMSSRLGVAGGNPEVVCQTGWSLPKALREVKKAIMEYEWNPLVMSEVGSYGRPTD